MQLDDATDKEGEEESEHNRDKWEEMADKYDELKEKVEQYFVLGPPSNLGSPGMYAHTCNRTPPDWRLAKETTSL